MDPNPDSLSGTDMAVLDVLRESAGRVVGRDTILRRAGLDHCGNRRCDSAIVSLRRMFGADSIVTVRRRGWMLTDDGVARVTDVFGERPTGRDIL